MAFVILHPSKAKGWAGRGSDFTISLKVHAKKTLPGFATPEWVEVVEELPVSERFDWPEFMLTSWDRKHLRERYRRIFCG